MSKNETPFFQYSRCLDRMIDIILPLKMIPAARGPSSLRWNLASELQNQIFSVSISIVSLTKISSEVDMKAVFENAQAILGLTRVLTELCNKFFYLVVDPVDELELQRRYAYYMLVGTVKFKTLTVNTMVDSASIASLDTSIADRQKMFLRTNPYTWTPFKILTSKEQGKILKGDTIDDYLKMDFNKAISKRLDQKEKSHYQNLGNIAIHSSSLLLSIQEEFDDEIPFQACIASFAIFNSSRHLALNGLELLWRFPELKNQISIEAGAELTQLARGIKQKDYLYV